MMSDDKNAQTGKPLFKEDVIGKLFQIGATQS